MTTLPLPIPNEDTLPFWEYCRDGELRVQRCLNCSTLRHPPRPTCARCGSFDFDWHLLSGRGRISRYAASPQAIHPALQDLVPHTIVLIELEEGIVLTSNLVDTPEMVEIGAPVEVVFERINDEITLPKFRLTS
jgi:uncharacterized protein